MGNFCLISPFRRQTSLAFLEILVAERVARIMVSTQELFSAVAQSFTLQLLVTFCLLLTVRPCQRIPLRFKLILLIAPLVSGKRSGLQYILSPVIQIPWP